MHQLVDILIISVSFLKYISKHDYSEKSQILISMFTYCHAWSSNTPPFLFLVNCPAQKLLCQIRGNSPSRLCPDHLLFTSIPLYLYMLASIYIILELYIIPSHYIYELKVQFIYIAEMKNYRYKLKISTYKINKLVCI